MAKSRKRPNRRSDVEAPETLYPIERLDGKKPKPRDVAAALARMLEDVSKHRRRRPRRYNRTCLRLTMQQLNRIRDRPLNSEMDDHDRNRLCKAGRDVLIVIGIGDNVVIVTHDNN